MVVQKPSHCHILLGCCHKQVVVWHMQIKLLKSLLALVSWEEARHGQGGRGSGEGGCGTWWLPGARSYSLFLRLPHPFSLLKSKESKMAG